MNVTEQSEKITAAIKQRAMEYYLDNKVDPRTLIIFIQNAMFIGASIALETVLESREEKVKTMEAELEALNERLLE